MAYTIIDAHAHLWLRQDTVVDGLPIRTLLNGRSMFMGEERQMLPPFMVDGVNSAEVFLSNMDYAQVGAAVITQEFIDGFQNDYLEEVARRYPDRFFVCGMCEFRKPGYLEEARQLIARGFKGIKIPAQRLLLKEGRVKLNCDEMIQMFRLMEQNGVLLSIDMADGDTQVGELEEVIAECPNLRVAIGHFGMVTTPGWTEQIKLARHPHVRIESGGITWLFNDEFYPFRGAVRAIREAADLVAIRVRLRLSLTVCRMILLRNHRNCRMRKSGFSWVRMHVAFTALAICPNCLTLRICRNNPNRYAYEKQELYIASCTGYTLPLALVFSLFFLWAISSNLLPTMIRQLMKTCELNTFEASFTESAYWLAYFIFPIPVAMFMKRYSYKAGIVFGLLLAAIGGLLFFPAALRNIGRTCVSSLLSLQGCVSLKRLPIPTLRHWATQLQHLVD